MKMKNKDLIYYIIIAVLAYLIYTKWQNMEGMEAFTAPAPQFPKDLSSYDSPRILPKVISVKYDTTDINQPYKVTRRGGSEHSMDEDRIIQDTIIVFTNLWYTRRINLFKKLNTKNELGKKILDTWKRYEMFWNNANAKENKDRMINMLEKMGDFGKEIAEKNNNKAIQDIQNIITKGINPDDYFKDRFLVPYRELYSDKPTKLNIEPENLLPIVLFKQENLKTVVLYNDKIEQDRNLRPLVYTGPLYSPKGLKIASPLDIYILIMSYVLLRNDNIFRKIQGENEKMWKYIKEVVGHRQTYKENQKRFTEFLKMLGAM